MHRKRYQRRSFFHKNTLSFFTVPNFISDLLSPLGPRPPAYRGWPLRRPSRPPHSGAPAPCTRTRHGAASAHTYTALTYFVRPYTLTGIRHTEDPMTDKRPGGSTLTTQPATATPGGADSILPGYNASTETPSSNNQSTDGTNQSTDAPRRRHTDTLTLGRPGD